MYLLMDIFFKFLREYVSHDVGSAAVVYRRSK